MKVCFFFFHYNMNSQCSKIQLVASSRLQRAESYVLFKVDSGIDTFFVVHNFCWPCQIY
jgi:hypothetical protein